MANPPIQVWMPNHPQATMPRNTEATWVPVVPKAARAKTGKVMPYLVPAWPFSTIGISTIRLPNVTVRMACHQFMPCLISPLASI